MKILITGVYGQLGSELQRQLIVKRSPIGPIASQYDDAEVIGVDIDSVDICDYTVITEFIKSNGFDIIFNCAGYTDVDGCETDREAAFRVNSEAPGYIAEAAKSIKAKFIHISTDYVFEGNSPTPRNEYDEPGPKTVYGMSKLYGENRVLDVDSNAIIVRTAWLYGLNGKNFVKTITSLARDRGYLNVVNDQTGNPTNAADLAHHLLKLALTEENGIFHCTNNGICSWYDFTVEIMKLTGIAAEVVPCTTEEFPRPAARPAYSALDNLRLRQTVGDEMRSWQDAIHDYIDELNKG